MNYTGINMNRKIIITAFVSVFAALLFFGCANTISNPVTTGNGTINISVYKPLATDTINYKGQSVIYDVTVDQGFKFVELYVNGIFVRNFLPNASGAKPAVSIVLDSSYMNTRISYQLKYYDSDNKYIEGPVISNMLVLDDRMPPSKPVSISLLQLTSTSFNISFKDTSHGNITHELWRKSNLDSDFSLYVLIPAGTSNINDSYVDPNEIYFYKVRGINNYGYSGFSDVVNTLGVGGSVNLPAPKLLTAIAVNTTIVRLTWQINSSTQNYFKIERKNYYDYTAIGIAARNATTFSDSLSGLVPGGQYTYRIKAISGNDSSWSNEITVSTPYNILATPVITALTNPSAGKVTLKYNVNNSPWADYCLFERKTGSGGTWAQIFQVDSWMTTYDDTTVQAGNTYYYRMRKYDVSGVRYSDYSNEMSINVILK